MYTVKHLALLFGFFAGAHLPAQTILTGRVSDAKTSESLAYVNLGIIGTTTGTVTGPDGNFTLILKDSLQLNQTLRFSYIGYQSKELTVKTLLDQKNEPVKLVASPIEMAEIVVKPTGDRRKTIGHDKTNAKMAVNFALATKPDQNLGSEIGRKFKAPAKCFIEKIRFYITNNQFDTVRFRINPYALKNGKPAGLLVNQNIILEVTGKKTGWIEAGLSSYQVFSPDREFAVAIEWVYASAKGRQLTMPITVPALGAIHFYKYGSQNKWKKFSSMSAAIEVSVLW